MNPPLPTPPPANLPGIPRCLCGAAKQSHHLTCWRCWQAVPLPLRKALQTPNDELRRQTIRHILQSVHTRLQPTPASDHPTPHS